MRWINIYAKIKSQGFQWFNIIPFSFSISYMYTHIISIDLIPVFIRLQTRDAILLEVTRGQKRRRVVGKRRLADRPQLKNDDGNEDDLRPAEIANNRIRYRDLNCPDRLHGRRKGGILPTNLYRKSLNTSKLECVRGFSVLSHPLYK